VWSKIRKGRGSGNGKPHQLQGKVNTGGEKKLRFDIKSKPFWYGTLFGTDMQGRWGEGSTSYHVPVEGNTVWMGCEKDKRKGGGLFV